MHILFTSFTLLGQMIALLEYFDSTLTLNDITIFVLLVEGLPFPPPMKPYIYIQLYIAYSSYQS